MKNFNILFTSAGRRVALINSFREALAQLGLKGRIITADLKPNAQAHFVSDARESVPRVTDKNYVSRLLEICKMHSINLLVPLIDPELHILSSASEDFKRAGVFLLTSSTETNKLCLDKVETFKFFLKLGVETTRIIPHSELYGTNPPPFPLFLKPRLGSGSVGAVQIKDKIALDFYFQTVTDPIVQEMAFGDEYSIDILTDLDGKVLSVVPRLRQEVRAGEICKGMTVKNQQLIEGGKMIVESLPGPFGCLTVQCFLTPERKIIYTEINPRFGGGIPLTIKAGANFPLWIIQMARGEKLSVKIDDWQDGLIMLRYDEAIYTREENIRNLSR
ncbi:MAG: ATP-grasp domain-containing protein [Candidatus Riflebacteria bacterium]|nr:ATP-grasp domain-containing protein [Candidatus Riflebacteria bacterium]